MRIFAVIILSGVFSGCSETVQTKTANDETKQKDEEVVIVTPNYHEKLNKLIAESGLTIRDNDYYNIVYFDTSYCQQFYDLYIEMSKTSWKNTPTCNDALSISVSTAFYKENLKEKASFNNTKSNKSKSTESNKQSKSEPIIKDWQIHVGDYKETVITLWGKPNRVASSENAYVKVEMLYYYDRNTIVTIADGKVEEITKY